MTVKLIRGIICGKLDALGLYEVRGEKYEIKYDSVNYFNKVS